MSQSSTALKRVLYLNAFALFAVAVALLHKPVGELLTPGTANATTQQTPAPIAGSGGVYLMPGQLSERMWGTYLIDTDAQTLMVYQFDANARRLRFMAARNFTDDRRLGNYNTEPAPAEIKAIADKAQQVGRVQPNE